MASTLDTFFEQRGRQNALLDQFEAKFGTIPVEIQEAINNANFEQLREWNVQILKAGSLDEMGFPVTIQNSEKNENESTN